MKFIIRIFTLFFLAASFQIQAAEKFFPLQGVNLPSKYIKDLKIFGDNLWIATAAGAVRYNIKTKAQKLYNKRQGLADNFINSIYVDAKDVWFATPKGLSKLNKRTGRVVSYTRRGKELNDDDVRSIIVDGDDVWVGTSLGVSRFQTKLNRWSTVDALQGLFLSEISSFVNDGNKLWLSGRGGIASYDKGQSIWETFDQGLNAEVVTSLVNFGDALFLGTEGGGLNKFSKDTGLFEAFTSSDGLIDDNILGLTPDGKYLWLETFSGVSRFDMSKDIFNKNYSAKQGLTEISTYVGVIYGNQVYIGTDGGGVNLLNKVKIRIINFIKISW